ncbi:WD40 repeat domain-containing protein [Streptomyces sp. NPDC005752]|uniref:WD40 repeat domain-containing protein n=1 Tax=Streptomyces sp. NPDC005752 TaxID=3157065 RepID=UPI0033CDB92F
MRRLPGWRWRPSGPRWAQSRGRRCSPAPNENIPVGRRRSTTSCTKTLTGHTGEVHSVAVSPDGTQLATSNMDWEVRPWNPSLTLPQTRGQQKTRSQPCETCLERPKPHVHCTYVRRTLHAKRPQKTRFPRSERFCLGMLGGAGGTRTQKGDASHLRKRHRGGHSHPVGSRCIRLDPGQRRCGAVRTARLQRGLRQ